MLLLTPIKWLISAHHPYLVLCRQTGEKKAKSCNLFQTFLFCDFTLYPTGSLSKSATKAHSILELQQTVIIQRAKTSELISRGNSGQKVLFSLTFGTQILVGWFPFPACATEIYHPADSPPRLSLCPASLLLSKLFDS